MDDNIKTAQDKATIDEFLRTGRLGQLRLGMSYAEMVAYLGLPPGVEGDPDELYDEWSSHKEPGYTVNLLYGNLGIFLLERKLEDITLYFRKNDLHFLPSALQADWLEHMYQMDTQAFRSFLAEHQIPAERSIAPWEEGDEQPFIRLYIPSSGVRVIIDLEDGADSIYLIGVSTLAHDNYATVPW